MTHKDLLVATHLQMLGTLDGLHLLIEFGVRPEGTNALPRALDFNDPAMVRLLLDAGAGRTDPAKAIVVVAVEIRKRCVFGHTDSFQDQYAGSMEKLGNGGIQWRRPTDAPAQPASERFLNLAENQLCGQLILQSG